MAVACSPKAGKVVSTDDSSAEVKPADAAGSSKNPNAVSEPKSANPAKPVLPARPQKQLAMGGKTMQRPKVVIFKTNIAVADLVPVQLSDSGEIIAYPAPADIAKLPALGKPEALNKGFWLSHGGIDAHTGFLKITRADYARSEAAPSLTEMKRLLLPGLKFEKVWLGPVYDPETHNQSYGNEVVKGWK